MRRRKTSPTRCFLGVTFSLATALAALGLQSWLIGITLATFLTYGYDKVIAGSERTRVPEKVLLALAISGGTVGALAGMQLFRHKTAKESFRLKFLLVIVVQIALIAAYYVLTGPVY